LILILTYSRPLRPQPWLPQAAAFPAKLSMLLRLQFYQFALAFGL
jgi:hypothetical protein